MPDLQLAPLLMWLSSGPLPCTLSHPILHRHPVQIFCILLVGYLLEPLLTRVYMVNVIAAVRARLCSVTFASRLYHLCIVHFWLNPRTCMRCSL